MVLLAVLPLGLGGHPLGGVVHFLLQPILLLLLRRRWQWRRLLVVCHVRRQAELGLGLLLLSLERRQHPGAHVCVQAVLLRLGQRLLCVLRRHRLWPDVGSQAKLILLRQRGTGPLLL